MNDRTDSSSPCPETAIARDVDEGILAWRARVLRVLLGFSSIIFLLPVLAILTGWGLIFPWPVRAVSAAFYLLLLVVALRPRWNPNVRAYLLLGLISVMGAIRLAVGQLEGSGRITLLLLPLLALLLVGPRAGWMAVGFGALLYAAVSLALKTGWLIGLDAAWKHPDLPLSYWGMQGLFLLIVVLTLMILFTRFQILQRRTMIAERVARRKLETETADRQRLEAEIIRIGEEERRRLGADLHDGLCQHLTAALLNCSAMENQRQADGGCDAGDLTQLRRTLEESIGMAYDVANGLCPVELDSDALIPALARLCRETRDRQDIDCRLEADRDVAVCNSEHALHLYRIAREAVTNAIQHARCRHISIVLEQAAGELVLRIADDGPQPAAGAVPVPGLGLGIMAHRAQLIGGSLRVEGGINGGMEVVCCVPVSGGAS